MGEKAHARIFLLELIIFGHPPDMYLSDVVQNLGSVGELGQKAMVHREVSSLDGLASLIVPLESWPMRKSEALIQTYLEK